MRNLIKVDARDVGNDMRVNPDATPTYIWVPGNTVLGHDSQQARAVQKLINTLTYSTFEDQESMFSFIKCAFDAINNKFKRCKGPELIVEAPELYSVEYSGGTKVIRSELFEIKTRMPGNGKRAPFEFVVLKQVELGPDFDFTEF